ncbi:glutathione peroxidase [Polyangium sorediatum]|uniref:Glutathione peroxidase n=1 Tax=Polyangium sorediatum TaxID=889274 RepID=A0ABT6P811_9BACT|nr:glutathione peroxidase [Polyangium sorediatum]MDI1436751.1 glutathione peroxidase [Polyangium sorediatum]
MKSLRVGSVVFAVLVGAAALVGCDGGSQPPTSPKAGTDPAGGAAAQEGPKGSLHDFKMKTIFGEERSLGDFRGKVVLVVNTASECGYTPQYAGLEKLHERFEAKGFSVLGFPSNDFGAQEPGTDAEIATFCTSKFGVKFPMFSKITVKGSDKHPLYTFLTQAAPAGEVKWNFEKFLVGKDGGVKGRFPSAVEPEDEKLVLAIEKALGS